MGKEKFKPGMRCFVEVIVERYDAAGNTHPVLANVGESQRAISFTNDGLYRTTHSYPSLFTSEEVAAKLHPELMAEIERLNSEVESMAKEYNNDIADLRAKLECETLLRKAAEREMSELLHNRFKIS